MINATIGKIIEITKLKLLTFAISLVALNDLVTLKVWDTPSKKDENVTNKEIVNKIKASTIGKIPIDATKIKTSTLTINKSTRFKNIFDKICFLNACGIVKITLTVRFSFKNNFVSLAKITLIANVTNKTINGK